MVKIAFYKHNGNSFIEMLINMGIKLWTMGPYSHVELVEQPSDDISSWRWLSAASYEGKVRVKTVEYDQSHWDIYTIESLPNPEAAISFIESQVGKKYDYIGILLSQILPFGWENPEAWFCSEIVRRALCEGGAIKCDRRDNLFSPNSLLKELRKHGVIV